MTIRRGPNKGKAIANIGDERHIQLQRLGRERALIYKTYLLTGLRKSELASFTVASLELDGPMPYAVLNAADEKNRRGSDIPLRADLVDDLRDWLADKLDAVRSDAVASNGQTLPLTEPPTALTTDTPLFNIPSGLVRILNRDLKLAGIPKRDERGRTIDVHGLRMTFGTLLSVGGVAPRTAQAAMRHSSIDLTMAVYTDPKLLDVYGAMDALPSLPLNDEPTPERMSKQATGTDDSRPFPVAPTVAPKSDNWCNQLSIVDNSDASSSDVQNEKKPEKPVVSQAFPMSGRLDTN
jgi:integrase